jgi:hypothetical protein
MSDDRDAAIGYLSRLVSGLVACAVVAVTLHASVGATIILGTALVLVLAMMCQMFRGAL